MPLHQDDAGNFKYIEYQTARINFEVLKPISLATLQIHGNPRSVIWLNATIGWEAITNSDQAHVDVAFKIFRSDTGQEIYSAIDTAQAMEDDHYATTHISYVDSGLPCDGTFYYSLTAELLFNGTAAARIIGPVTFTALEMGQSKKCGKHPLK